MSTDDPKLSDGLSEVDQRSHGRVDAIGRCFAVIGGGWEGSVLNVSQSGLLLRVKRQLQLGSAYYMKLLWQGNTLVVLARVARAVASEDEFEFGMEFVEMSAEDRFALRQGIVS